MFLSRLTLRPDAGRSRGFWTLGSDGYSFHQAVWRLFGDHEERRRDFLYRLGQQGLQTEVLTLSKREPADPDGLWRVETRRFSPALAAGDRLSFQLRANPTVTRKNDAGKAQRHDVIMDRKQRLKAEGIPQKQWPPAAELIQQEGTAWLERRAERLGVELVAVRADGYLQHTLKPPGRREIHLSTCDLQGHLTVADPERLLTALRGGIGPAKGFGCGLMLLKRQR